MSNIRVNAEIRRTERALGHQPKLKRRGARREPQPLGHMPYHGSAKLGALLLSVLVVMGVVAAIVLFRQVEPPVPILPHTTSNCGSTVPTPPTILLGSDGDITFSCQESNPDTHPAITINATVTLTSTTTGFAPPYTTLWLYIANGTVNTGNCSMRDGAVFLASNQTTVIQRTYDAGGYNYCARYHNADATELPGFYVDWAA